MYENYPYNTNMNNMPYPYPPADSYAVPAWEKKQLKSEYFGIFIRLIAYDAIGTVLSLIMLFTTEAMGFDQVRNGEGAIIIDAVTDLVLSIGPVIAALIIFTVEIFSRKQPIKSYFPASRITGGMVIGTIGMCMLMYIVAMICVVSCEILFEQFGLTMTDSSLDTELAPTPSALIMSFITTVILAPVAEELMFRGVILRRLSNISSRFGIFASALIFGMMHGNLTQAILGFFVGIVLAYSVVKTGSLAMSIAGHMAINLMGFSSDFANYFIGKENGEIYWYCVLGMCAVVGLITLIVLLARRKIHPPAYTEYHRRRTFPVILTCVSFYVLVMIYIVNIVSSMGTVAE